MATAFDRINPDVKALISPIMERATWIYMTEQQNKVNIGNNRGEQYTEDKLRCVHLIWNNGYPQPMTYRTSDGKLKCKVCGREIGTEFNEGAVKSLLEARKVVEQLMFFGMTNNMRADRVDLCIKMKEILPMIATMVAELNEYVTRENNNVDTINNVGVEYQVPNITAGY